MYDYISASMLDGVIQEKEKNRPKQISLTAVATSDRTLDFICKTPAV